MEEISKLEFADQALPPSRPRAAPRPVKRWIKNQTHLIRNHHAEAVVRKENEETALEK